MSGNLELGGNFRKFSLIVNITDNPETSVDLNETMRAMPMNRSNHENNVLVLLLVHSRDVNFVFFQKSILVLKKSIFFRLSNLCVVRCRPPLYSEVVLTS